jgi:hypothetical protein
MRMGCRMTCGMTATNRSYESAAAAGKLLKAAVTTAAESGREHSR